MSIEMNENPYESPRSADGTELPRFQRLCGVMFWITSILSIVAAYIAFSSAYSNYLAMQEMGGRMPTYIVAVTILAVCCSACLAFSAVRWRKAKVRSGAITFVLAILVYFIGPFILLFTLVN